MKELSHAIIGTRRGPIPRSVTLDGVTLPGVIKSADIGIRAGAPITLTVTFYLGSFESRKEPDDLFGASLNPVDQTP